MTSTISPSKPTIVLPLLNAGKYGKSTVLALFLAWAFLRGLRVRAYDLDPDHRTLANQHPGMITPIDLSDQPVGDILRVLSTVSADAMTVLDLRAHLKAAAIEALAVSGCLDSCEVIALVIPTESVESLEDIASTFDELGDRVKWVIARNLGRVGTLRLWDNSPLRQDFLNTGAVEIAIPLLLRDAVQAVQAAEIKTGRALALTTPLTEPGLVPVIYECVLASWLKKVFVELDRLAPLVAPELGISPAPPVDLQAKSTEPRRRGARLGVAQ